MTIIGDIFELAERARIQGFFSGVWGVSSVVGPAVGGLIVDHFSWRWVFYINVPFGLLSAILLLIAFRENIKRTKHTLDNAGSLALTGSIVALLFALLQGGTDWAWTSPQSIGLFAVFVILLVFFLWQEKRAPEPILPLTLFKNRIIVIASIGNLILGVTLFGITTYIPLFVQGVKGGAATDAGIALIPMLLSWPIASMVGGRLILRFGYRTIAVTGAALTTLGAAMMLFLNQGTSLPFLIVSMIFVGTGLGFDYMAFILAVQDAVPWNRRGVATASTQFMRTIGGTIGVAFMGTILNAQIAKRFTPIFARFTDAAAHLPKNVTLSNILLTPNIHSLVPVDFLQQLQIALSQSLFWVYLVIFVLMLVSLGTMFLTPGGNAEALKYQGEGSEATERADAAQETSLIS